MSQPRKFEILPTAMTLVIVATLCTLGTWQLQRLEWKNGLISALNEQYQIPAHDLPSDPAILSDEADLKRMRLSGTLLFDKEVEIVPRTFEGEVGSHVITPMQLYNGSTLLVNRGFAPNGMKRESPKTASVTYSGLIRLAPSPNMFTPQNMPEQNTWYHPSPREIADAKELGDITPYVFYPENEGGHFDLGLKRLQMPPMLKNDHLYYACFWFTMAGIMVIIYLIRQYKSGPE